MIRTIEELSMNAFPALQSLFYDGWVIRMSDGRSKRVNSVYSVYPSKIGLEEKISYCENIFDKNRLRRVFKLTEQDTCGELDSYLRNRGYSEAGRTCIETMDISRFSFNAEEKIEYLTDFSKEWYADLCDADGRAPIDRKVVAESWKNVDPDQCFISILKEGKRVAFGRGVLDRGYLGIYGIFVIPSMRRSGLGDLVTRALMKYGKDQGCHRAYLQVEMENTKAKNLYGKIGFAEIYQYWYLLKEAL